MPCRNPVSLDALHRRRTGVGLLLRWCVPRVAENLSAGRVVATSICVRCPHPCLPLIKATTVCHTLTSVSLSRRPSLISRLSLPRLYLLVLFSLPSAFLRISETLEFVEIRHASLKNGSWFSRRNTQISVGVHSARGAREREADSQTEKGTVWTQEKLIYPYLSLVGCIGSCSPEETHSRRPASSKSSCPKLPEGDAGSVGVRASRTSFVA